MRNQAITVNHKEPNGVYGSHQSVARIILVTLGGLVTIGGVGLWLLLSEISAVDTGSVATLIGRGTFDTSILQSFHFTPWREPTAEIRPFTFGSKSFRDATIIRYRRGSQVCRVLLRQTYYEAEYRMPDGKTVVDAAWGPMPFTSPNYWVVFPIIASGIVMLVVAALLKRKKLAQSIIGELECE